MGSCRKRVKTPAKLLVKPGTCRIQYSTAVMAQIVQTGDKSMKLGTIAKFTKVNNFGYGVTVISPMESRTEHAPKY